MQRFRTVLALPRFVFAMAWLIAAFPSEKPESTPLKKVADVPLSGPAVRFDYQSLDPSQGRLYISHMSADQLIVFDTSKRAIVATLDGFPSVHCMAFTRSRN
jgi:hypothetical protein